MTLFWSASQGSPALDRVREHRICWINREKQTLNWQRILTVDELQLSPLPQKSKKITKCLFSPYLTLSGQGYNAFLTVKHEGMGEH